jgi:hypothetical protein
VRREKTTADARRMNMKTSTWGGSHPKSDQREKDQQFIDELRMYLGMLPLREQAKEDRARVKEAA